MRNNIVAASGFFNPLHSGHIRYLRAAKALGNTLVVIVNSDAQVEIKGSRKFMDEEERMDIVSSLKFVDFALIAIDEDGTVAKTLATIKPDIFAKGGDRTIDNLPENEKIACKEHGIEIFENVGGHKISSSSSILDDFLRREMPPGRIGFDPLDGD